MNCMFCDAAVPLPMKLLGQRYCSTAHEEAYFERMDRLGVQRLTEARPRASIAYEPCTKPIELGLRALEQAVQVAAEPKPPKLAVRIRTQLDLARGDGSASFESSDLAVMKPA